MRNPFTDDIFAAGGAESEGEPSSFQRQALEALETSMGEVGQGMGRALLVTAPRAGYGKSHLMARFASGLMGRAVVVPLTFDLESPPRWLSVVKSVVEKVHRDHGHRMGLTMLDEAARYLFARANQKLIENRRIPCAHPAEAVAALDRNYLEMFDFANPEQVVARWFSEHFENLVPLSAECLAAEAGMEPERAAHWLRVLVGYAQSVDEPPSRRLDALKWSMHAATGPALGPASGLVIQETAAPEQMAKDMLRDFGRLVGLYRPLVFVIDHLDIFYRDWQSGLKVAYYVGELRRLLPRSLTVVCANQDLWQATFANQLPSALEDRIRGGAVSLESLTLEEARELVHARLAGAGLPPSETSAFWNRLHLSEFWAAQHGRPISPRMVLRHAASCWTGSRDQSKLPGSATNMASPVSPTAFIPMAGGEAGAAREEAAPAASSVVGEETLDSISAALHAMVGGGESPSTSSAPSGGAGPFHRLREKLDQWRPTRESAAAAAAASNTPPSSGLPPQPVQHTNGQCQLGRLSNIFADHVRRRAESPVPATLDLERLGRLLRFAGDHFPAVRAAEMGVPGTSGPALQWLSPDAEILIGLESATRPIFWSALTAHATARFRLNGGLPVKVVAFTEPDSFTHPASTGRAGAGFVLDLVSPNQDELCRLAAAVDVLESTDQSGSPIETQDLATLLANELDPFWRRLTRVAAPQAAG